MPTSLGIYESACAQKSKRTRRVRNSKVSIIYDIEIMSSDSDAFQSSFSLFSTPLPRLQQLSSLVAPPSQSGTNSRSAPRRLNSPKSEKSAGGFAIAAPPSSPPPTYAHVVQRQHSQDILEPASHSLAAVASAMSAGVQVAPQIARKIGPMIPSVSDPPFPICWPATESRLPSAVFDPILGAPHLSQSTFDHQSTDYKAPHLSTSFEFFGSDLWNPSPSKWGWSPWMPPDTSQHQQPLSFFGASAVNTLADSLIEPAVVLGSGDVLLPADALKQLMAASVSSKAGVTLSVQRVGSSLLVNTLSSQEDVSFDNIDSLSPFTLPNRDAMFCCLRCHLPKAICSCVDVSPRKSIGNGEFDTGTSACILKSIILMNPYFALTAHAQVLFRTQLMICRQLCKHYQRLSCLPQHMTTPHCHSVATWSGPKLKSQEMNSAVLCSCLRRAQEFFLLQIMLLLNRKRTSRVVAPAQTIHL